MIIHVQAPKEYALQIAGLKIQEPAVTRPLDQYVEHIEDDTIICRCERVTAREIRSLIRAGFRDMNEIKSVSRAGMGACGSKTCNALIHRLFKEEGVLNGEVTENTRRPLFVEVPLGVFAGVKENEEE
jgi:NAD(P)H-nitrite reductase large subunit